MGDLLQSNANTHDFVSQQIERLIIFVRKCTDCQKDLLNMLENVPAIGHRKEDKEESQISELLFAAEIYEQLQSDVKQGTGFYEMLLRILKYFSMILRKIEEDKEQRAEDAAISAFINLIDELRVDTQDNSQTDDQLEESADNTRGSMPEDDAEQSSFKGFKRRRSVLSSAEEQVVFPVKNLRLAGAANDHNLSTPGDFQDSILTTYHLPTTGFPYRAGFLIPCRAYSDG